MDIQSVMYFVSAGLIIVLGVLYAKAYAKNEILEMLSKNIAEAEVYFSESGKGDEKKAMVYKVIRDKLPASVGLFVTDEMLDKLIETTLEGMQILIEKANKDR